MTQPISITPATYLLLALLIVAMVGVSYMVRLLKVNSQILREHRIRRATGLMEGDPDAEEQADAAH